MRALMMVMSLFITMSMVGCASHRVGTFSNAPISAYQMMVTDAVDRLVTLYPPAHTCFQLNQKASDPFGMMLIKALRSKGYSVVEPSTKRRFSRAVDKNMTRSVQGISLNYVVDSPNAKPLYRVSVMVGCKEISRAYGLNEGRLHPLGAWSHKES